jgi:hypothetical protein
VNSSNTDTYEPLFPFAIKAERPEGNKKESIPGYPSFLKTVF